MRLWSIHPSYLDARGLVALWREGLLAQQVLLGNTRGYKHHPQLLRFRNTSNPAGAVASYLAGVAAEADARGYNFDRSRIVKQRFRGKITVTHQQVEYEFVHLMKKLSIRDRELYRRFKTVKRIKPHPLFRKTRGEVEAWEKT